jgi:hypothetical protein
MNLANVAKEIQHRIISIFTATNGSRPSNGGNAKMDRDPHFRDHILFHEVLGISSIDQYLMSDWCIFHSFSTVTMVVDWGHLTKLDGSLILSYTVVLLD